MDIKNNGTLSHKSIAALKWNYIGRFAAMFCQFVIGIVLARVLGPEPFGLVAIALFVIGLGIMFSKVVFNEYLNPKSGYIRREKFSLIDSEP